MKKVVKSKKKKLNEGITLIALVVTIIVLLILAGVAISMLSGDNGILRTSNKSKRRNYYWSRKGTSGNCICFCCC